MEGEDEDSGDSHSLVRQGFWKQFVILAAGSATNFLAGFLIILLLYSSAAAFLVPEVVGAAPEFSSQNGATLEKGDIISSLNGERVYVYSDVDLLLQLNRGKPLDLVVQRDGKSVELQGLPWGTYTGTNGEAYQGNGLYISRNATEEATIGAKLRYSWLNTLDFVRVVRLSLQMLVSGEAGMKDVSGPVGIVSTLTQVGEASDNARDAVDNILFFAAMLAVNLAVMNLLPIPALDGGRIFFLVVDAVSMALFRKKVPEKYQMAVNSAGFVLLMGFMLLVTFQDIWKLFQ
ncbi:MAG: M50 family metallopeptidase, partial [Oscillibacter sp.]